MGNFGEAYDAYFKKKGNIGEELLNKIEINRKRVYKKIDGVVTKIENREENK